MKSMLQLKRQFSDSQKVITSTLKKVNMVLMSSEHGFTPLHICLQKHRNGANLACTAGAAAAVKAAEDGETENNAKNAAREAVIKVLYEYDLLEDDVLQTVVDVIVKTAAEAAIRGYTPNQTLTIVKAASDTQLTKHYAEERVERATAHAIKTARAIPRPTKKNGKGNEGKPDKENNPRPSTSGKSGDAKAKDNGKKDKAKKALRENNFASDTD